MQEEGAKDLWRSDLDAKWTPRREVGRFGLRLDSASDSSSNKGLIAFRPLGHHGGVVLPAN